MILTKEIDIKITKQNFDYYKNLGYDIKLKDIIIIPIKDLQKNSHKKIIVKCDINNEESILSYKLYNKNIKKYNIYTCSKCSSIKNKKTLLNKCGVEHQMYLDTTKKKIQKTKKEKYKDENYNKRKKTILKCLNKYQTNSPLESKKILDKIKNTNLIKYDNQYFFGSDKFKSIIKNIFFNKYGVDNPSKSKYLQTIKLKKLYKDLDILDIDFIDKSYKIKCEKCHKEYKIPFLILHERYSIYKTILCTLCNPIGSYSNSGFEIQLQNFIKNNYTKTTILNPRNIIKPYEIDIYLPDLKLAFEFNGLFWHNELGKNNNYHLIKTELCEEQGIHLIHIYEDDWLYKSNIVKSRILNLLGQTPNKFYARKCIIKKIIDNKLIRDFLEVNHLQGFVGSQIKLGLFYNDELVSLMTFGEQRKSMGLKSKNNVYELLRFCNKLNTSVIGGADKLFKYFIKNYKPKEVISYADRSWSQGDLYKKLGFNFVRKTPPNYYYIIGNKKYYRFNFRKDKLIREGFDSLKSEHEIMLERKIYRIYDSGSLKMKYNI